MARNPRLKDVAERAGVSIATASAVARGASGGAVRISDATRARVQAVIDELDYRPNTAARSLRTNRTGLIAVVVPDLTNPLFPEFVRSAQLEAERFDAHLMVWDSHQSPAREHTAVTAVLERGVDGVVLVTDHLEVSDVRHLLEAGIAVSTTDRRLDVPMVDIVSEDLTGTAHAAVTHLIDLGHRRIAHVAGDRSTVVGASRLAGYRDALGDEQIRYDPSLVVNDSFEPSSARKALRELMDLPVTPTAVFAANDVLAIGVLQECHAMGVTIPGELSIIGIDDSPVSDAVTPGLTSMDPKPNELARRLVELTVGRLDERRHEPGVREILESSLAERSSTARRSHLPPATHNTTERS